MSKATSTTSTQSRRALPKLRGVTGFVRLDRERYQEQLQQTLAVLRPAKTAFEQGGYEVQSVRITTQPFPELVRGLTDAEAAKLLLSIDQMGPKERFDPAVGPAMMSDDDDPRAMDLLSEVLSAAKLLQAIASIAEERVHRKVIQACARMLKRVAAESPQSQGTFNFAATALVPSYSAFYPGSWHNGPGREFALAIQSANVVEAVFEAHQEPDQARRALQEEMNCYAVALEKIAFEVEKQSGWRYMGLDVTPAPLKEVSIAAAIEKFTGAPFGSSGTMTAAALITSVLRAIPVKRAGYSGLMLPIMEDDLLGQRWGEGRISIDSLLAYSAVCGTGLDTVPLPGEVTQGQLEQILTDVATMALKLRKPLSARLMPVEGKKAGERTEFSDPFLSNTVLQPLP